MSGTTIMHDTLYAQRLSEDKEYLALHPLAILPFRFTSPANRDATRNSNQNNHEKSVIFNIFFIFRSLRAFIRRTAGTYPNKRKNATTGWKKFILQEQ